MIDLLQKCASRLREVLATAPADQDLDVLVHFAEAPEDLMMYLYRGLRVGAMVDRVATGRIEAGSVLDLVEFTSIERIELTG